MVPEGLNGRTWCHDDPTNWRICLGAPRALEGRPFFLPCLNSHKPIDLVVLGLGTNDLKHKFGLQPHNVRCSAGAGTGTA